MQVLFRATDNRNNDAAWANLTPKENTESK